MNSTKCVVESDQLPKAVGPYSHGIEAKGLVFTSGQTGADSRTGNMPDTIEEQTLQALNNLKTVLEAAGVDLSRVLKVTVFLKNMDDFSAMNRVYASCFGHPYPARSTVAVRDLVPGALVEIEAIALASN